MVENHGITVTSTAGHDSNANGRAERPVLWFREKSRTFLYSRIRSNIFQEHLLQLWTFAVQQEKFTDDKSLENQLVSMNLDNVCWQELKSH